MLNNLTRKSSRPDSQSSDYPTSGRNSAASMQALGAMLRERREAMGVTLAEVEVATRIRQKYLSALEAEEWHLLPGEVVGRGFLRNYADYLWLEPQDVMDRRRAVTDVGMNQALSITSAGAPLPPEREVDYRPKEVELKDDGDGIQRGEIQLAPILGILALAALVILGWWGVSALSSQIGEAFDGAQTRVAAVFDEPEATPTLNAIGVVNNENLPGSITGVDAVEGAMAATPAGDVGVVPLGSAGQTGTTAPSGEGSVGVAPPANAGQQPPAALPPGEQPAAQPSGEQGGSVLVPTETPAVPAPAAEVPVATPAIATATLEPPTPAPVLPTETPVPPTPEPLPTETPTPEPPPAVAAAPVACGDGRLAISAPGAGQVIGGVTGVTGSASHEAFQFFKLEYAPGANAGGGFVYFAGSNVPVSGGLLGNFDTTALPNGDYTIRLTVVDQSSNFPPPCDVSVVIQN